METKDRMCDPCDADFPCYRMRAFYSPRDAFLPVLTAVESAGYRELVHWRRHEPKWTGDAAAWWSELLALHQIDEALTRVHRPNWIPWLAAERTAMCAGEERTNRRKAEIRRMLRAVHRVHSGPAVPPLPFAQPLRWAVAT